MRSTRDKVVEGVREVFDVACSFEEGVLEGAHRLLLGNDLGPLFVASSDRSLLVSVRRHVLREFGLLTRLGASEARLDELKRKTASLLPGGTSVTDAVLHHWDSSRADMELVGGFAEWALVVDGEVVRRNGMSDRDIQTTLVVLSRTEHRAVPIGSGELYGVRVGEVAVIVRSIQRLQQIDQELVSLQAFLIQRLHAEKKHLRHLEAMRVRAEEAARARAEFLAHMSHELRTPLNGIVGVAQLLAESDPTDEQRQLLEVQLRSASWLREVVDAVLDLSKAERGAIVLECLPVDLRELVRTAISSVRMLANEKGLRISATVSEDIPEWASCDPTRIRQALLNLLSNAIKFTAEGGVRIHVDRVGELTRFTVDDDGVGVDPERLENIFEPFVQADDSTTRRFGGTGLGLPLVREFARMHGGESGATSTPGVGSSVWFTANLPASAPPIEQTISRSSSGNGGPSGLRILLAEDQPVNQLVATRMLEVRGHDVTVVDNGATALELLAEDAGFDAVMLDGMMPGQTGSQVAAALRATSDLRAKLYLVAVTAAVLPDDLASFERAGFDDVLTKPLDRTELDRVLAIADSRRVGRTEAAVG